MAGTMIKDYLDSQHTCYMTIGHPRAFTAQETAEVSHVSGKEMAKTVVVNIDGEMAMVVVPANRRVDLEMLAQVAEAQRVRLASEQEFKRRFPGCEVGAMPPLGTLYGMEVVVDEKLAEDREIAFNAGTHTELIVMPYAEFERLVSPWIARVSQA